MKNNLSNQLKKSGLVLLAILCMSWTTWAQTVTVNDTAFKTYLLTLVDAANGGNSDGQIQVSEAEAFTGSIEYINPNSKLSDATGIEAFINITALNLNSNSLSSIDVSDLVDLVELKLANNGLSAIDVSSNGDLEILNLYGNDFVTLSFVSNPNLNDLDVAGNLLTSISLTNVPGLTNLVLFNNSLTTIDLTSNSLLEDLDLTDNTMSNVSVTNLTNLDYLTLNNMGLMSIDLSSNVNLTGLDLSNNNLTSIDLRANTLLESFYGDENDLSTLNLASGANATLTDLYIVNNPSLTCVTVDNVDNASASWTDIDAQTEFSTYCGAPFITTWETTADDEGIFIPTGGAPAYNYTVDWGDENITTGHTTNASHTYATAGVYTVSISGSFPRININNVGNPLKIKSIEQWGDIEWSSFQWAFSGCAYLQMNATDAPDLSEVSSLQGMFINTGFTADFSNWDISTITNISQMFYGNSNFNGDIGSWNVEKVINMNSMFFNAEAFDQDLAGWDISLVTNMTNMFTGSGMSLSNYDNTLIGWVALDTPPSDIILGATGLTYCDSETARNTLIGTYNWNFSGDALDCPIVTINDAGFKTYLLTLVDSDNGGNSDGEIQVNEAEAFTGSVIYSDQGLSDAVGIEAFVNITVLALSQNNLTTIDVTSLVNLTDLILTNNGIETIDLSTNVLLDDLFMADNSLNSLDLSNNINITRAYLDNNLLTSITFGSAPYHTIDATNNDMETLTIDGVSTLEYFDFAQNEITSVSFTNCTTNQLRLDYNLIGSLDMTGSSISRLSLSGNNLSTLDLTDFNMITHVYVSQSTNLSSLTLSSLTDLKLLYASECAFPSIDLSNNTVLENLWLAETPVTSLDLSNNTALTNIDLEACALTSLNVQNGNNSNVTNFDVRGNSSLTCIEVDNVSYSNSTWTQKESGTSYSLVCAPELESSTILDDSEYGSANLNFTLIFNEEVAFNESSNMFRVYRAASESYQNISGDITGTTSNSVSFEVSPLYYGEDYSILIDANAVEDLAGNTYTGITDLTTLNFTATWEQPVVTRLPTQLALGIAIDSDISMTFDRNMTESYNSNIGIYNLRLLKVSGSEIIEDVFMNDTNLTLGSNTLSFNPSEDLEFGTMYRVIVSNGVLETDAEDGQTWKGIYSASGDDSWYFTTASAPDLSAPSPSAYSPVDNTTEVSRSTNLILTFNEDIALGNGTIRLGYVGLSGQQFATYSVPSASEVTVSGDQLIINPDEDFLAGTELNVEIGDGVIEDLSGNAYAGFIDETTWNFTMVDDEVPLHTSLSPSHESTYGTLNSSVGIVFNEDMQEGTGTVSLYEADGTWVETISTGISNSRVSFPATFRTNIDFGAEYVELAEYYVVVSVGAFEDLAGNAHAGIEANEWGFTANARPHISTLSPADDATGVATDAVFTMTLDNAVWANSETSLEIRNYDTDLLIESVSIADVETMTGEIQFTPTLLVEGLHAYIVLNNDGNIASSTNGEGFTGLDDKDEWDFTTEEADKAPEIASMSPTSTDVNPLGVTISFTFDEPVIAHVGDVEIKRKSDNGVAATIAIGDFTYIDPATFSHTLSTDLEYGTEYYVIMPGDLVEDEGVSVNDGISDTEFWTFATVEVDKVPEISSMSPTATDVNPADVTISFTFDEPVIAHVGDVEIKRKSDDEVVAVIEINDFSYTAPATFSYTLSTDLDYATEYYVIMPGDLVEDEGVHVNEGISDTNFWNFTTDKEEQTLSFTTITNRVFGDANFDLTATASSSLAVAFSVVSGPAAINGNTLTITAVGEVVVAADQIGDESFNSAPQATQSFTVAKADQTITFASLTDKVFGDASFDLSGSSTSALAINFSIVSGPATIDENTVTLTGAGNVTISAIQTGDANYNPATEVTKTFTVSKQDQTITITAIDDKVITDVGFDVVAITDSELALTYAVSGPANNTGATISLSGESGTVTVTVSQAGNDNYNEASDQITFNVTDLSKTDQTITFGELADRVFGDADFDLNAMSNSTLEVSFSVVSGPATVSDDLLTLTGAGEVVIAADQEGDGNFNPAPQVTQSFTVAQADQTISFSAIDDKVYGGANFDVSATASSELEVLISIVSGPATISGSTVTLTGAGEVVIAAVQGGDDNYNAGLQVEHSFTVAKADQLISITAIGDKLTNDELFEVSATTDSGLDLIYEISGPASISGTTISLSGESGTVTVTVSQEGSSNYNATSEQVNFNVTDPSKTDQTITFDALEDKVFGDADFELSATANSSLTVSYAIVGGPATISGSIVTITGAGEVTIAANQEGSDTFNPAGEVTRAFTVAKANQTITINSINDKFTTDESFTVSATVDTGLPLTYVVSGPATLLETTITLSGEVGTVTVTLSQAGNDNYNAGEAATSFEVTEPVVEKEDQVITIATIVDKLTTDALFDVVASCTSGLELTYAVSGPASMDGTTISLDGTAGTITVTVGQAGNDSFNAATESVTFEVTEEATLSTRGQIEIQAYPNPIVDRIHVKGLDSQGVLELYSLRGKLVLSENVNSRGVLVADIEAGVYILKIIANNSITTTKVLIGK